MKKFDMVCLLNDKISKELGIDKNDGGVIVSINNDFASFLWTSNMNQGDYAFADVKISDLKVIGHLPSKLESQVQEFLENVNKDKHKTYKEVVIKEFDKVELLVEDEKYSQYGIHKGAIGCVAENYLIKDKVMVDFSTIDKDGNLSGDTIVVKVCDLKIL